MADQAIPPAELLNRLLCTVAETMWGVALVAEAIQTPATRGPTQAVALQLRGEPDFVVVVGWAAQDAAALQAAFSGALERGAPSPQVEVELLGDSVGELVNILAGQVKSELALEHQLGLPRSISPLATPVSDALMQSASSRLYAGGANATLFVGAFTTQAFGPLA